MMRTAIFTILTALVTVLPAAAQPPAEAAKARAQAERDRREDRRAEQVENFSRSVKVGAQGELDLQNMSGSITVTRGGGNELKIDAVKKARAATDEAAREMLQLVTIEVTERAGRVEVRTRYPHVDRERQRRGEHRNMNVSVAYNITAPAGTRMRINSMSGGISVSDIGGELSLEAMSGHITVERAARLVAAKTMSGDVTVTDAKSDAMLTTGSMSGDVTLKQVTAREISAEVISGTITLIDVGCDRLGAQTTSGNVSFEGKLADRGRYKFGAHSGNIKIALAGDTGFQLDANSWGGNVKSELALKNTEQGVADSRRARGGGSGGRIRMLKGTYGDGSAVLDLSTFSGTIVITRRVADGR
jgi:DUF4097 and DUF4098 domain-containing protein YvlB